MQKNKKKREKWTLEIINKVYESENNTVQQKIKKMRDLYLQGKSPYHKQSIAEYTIELIEDKVN